MADAAGESLEEPHVGTGAGQLDVSQALAAHAGERHLHAALVADHAAMLHALVLAAQALPIGHRTEDAGAEQPVPLGFEGPVADGLGLGYLAMRPTANFFRRRQT